MDTEIKILMTIFFLWIIGVATYGSGIAYDSNFIEPVAAENANTYCQSIGFDQYKSFSRVGLFSQKPVGIKCEYAEKYTDLGIRTNP